MKFIEKGKIFDWFNIIVFSSVFLGILAYKSYGVQNSIVTQTNIFSGETASNLTAGAPLVVSSTGKVASGLTVLTTGQVTSTITLSTTTPTLATGMTLTTPAAGSYLCGFDTYVQTGTGGNSITVTLFLNTTTTGIARTVQFPTATLIDSGYPFYIGLNMIPVTVNGSQSIQVFWATSASAAQQSSMFNRALTCLRTN